MCNKSITEVWKPIKDYEGLYEVSNLGRVKSLERVKIRSNYKPQPIPEKILKPDTDKLGYKRVRLYNDKKSKKYQIHRIVAETFIPNPNNNPFVNHIDCNPSNNCVENLEWVTHKENMEYAAKLNRMKGAEIGKKLLSKPIIAINKLGNKTYFSSIKEAERQLGFRCINNVLSGKLKSLHGYTFKYAEQETNN